jgi:Domain of unknown function (DUF4234)
VANTGPLGQQRGILFVILISLVTLGIYSFYWVYVTCDETKRHRGGEGIGGIIALLIQFVFSPINWFVIPSEVGNMYREDGQEPNMTGWTGAWMFLPLAGWIIWIVKVQGRLNRYWEGKQSGTAPVAPEIQPGEPPAAPAT